MLLSVISEATPLLQQWRLGWRRRQGGLQWLFCVRLCVRLDKSVIVQRHFVLLDAWRARGRLDFSSSVAGGGGGGGVKLSELHAFVLEAAAVALQKCMYVCLSLSLASS